MKAREIMTRDVLTVHRDDQARRAVEIMAENDISGLPVVNDAGELVGIVTESDLLMLDKAEPPRVKTALYGLWIEPDRMVEEDARRRGLLVQDVMTRRVVSFGPDDSVAKIAKVMAEKRIKRVPIVEGNRVVGIVSRHDIIRALAEGKSLE
jgi:CBS domain-containing protein